MKDRINVTKTFLPPIEEYTSILKKAYDNCWLTNRGPLVIELEKSLMSYLNISNILIMNNGTIPLQIALKLLGGKGEVITTPFSYIATTSSILWEDCNPVFIDIDRDYLTIDENLIENSVTVNTKAILATHVFGNPCNVEVIDNISKKYNIPVIYDAAHCFGVKYNNRSVFEFGDISTCSFHATKLFHTGEGGAIFCNDEVLRHNIYYSHNFGHNGPLDFFGVGINGKISELQAAMGLAVFPYIDQIISERKNIVDFYLNNLRFDELRTIKIRENTQWNYSYFPIIFKDEQLLLSIEEKLVKENIIPRRYFYPSLNTVKFVKYSKCVNSEEISKSILCLPLYHGLSINDAQRIVNIINANI